MGIEDRPQSPQDLLSQNSVHQSEASPRPEYREPFYLRNYSCWYEISWQGSGFVPATEGVKTPRPQGLLWESPAIVLRIHEKAVEGVEPPELQESLARSYIESKHYRFGEFVGNLERPGFVGFDGVILNQGKEGAFYELVAPLPAVQYYSEDDCHNCEGSGDDKVLEDECCCCHGKGKELIFDLSTANRVAASLSIFLSSLQLDHFDTETSAPFPQLMTVRTNVNLTYDYLYGEMSPVLYQWLLQQEPQGTIPETTKAMADAWRWMHRGKILNEISPRTWIARGALLTEVPGTDCSIFPVDWEKLGVDRGYELSSKVDGVPQQLTLLAGLAALHDRARAELMKV